MEAGYRGGAFLWSHRRWHNAPVCAPFDCTAKKLFHTTAKRRFRASNTASGRNLALREPATRTIREVSSVSEIASSTRWSRRSEPWAGNVVDSASFDPRRRGLRRDLGFGIIGFMRTERDFRSVPTSMRKIHRGQRGVGQAGELRFHWHDSQVHSAFRRWFQLLFSVE